MLKKFNLLFNTLRFITIKQIVYQFYKRLQISTHIVKRDDFVSPRKDNTLSFSLMTFEIKQIVELNNHFSFLNLEKKFSNSINWNFLEYGKLWNYNLEYFNYLDQNNISVNEKLDLITDFYQFSIKNKRVLEPYPVSLRAINLIKFSVFNQLDDKEFHDYLFQELSYLDKHYEHHILGNHLLENAFALCMGGAFYSNEKWHNRAIKILRKELDEQILSDGAHFELSPMYHQIILFRVLELIDWYSNYEQKNESFLQFCRQKAELMLDWLENISFRNGEIPLFNDAAKGIAYKTNELLGYATQLGIRRNNIVLGDSGYRSFANEKYEIKVDFAQIGASYQPGHAHADALSFILYYDGKPLFVEQGTSTYNIGKRRDLERSTEAHNTVVVNGKDQSQVWGGFRVAKRAKTRILLDSLTELKASHDGYKKQGIIHERAFQFGETIVQIKDTLSVNKEGVFYLHIHPDWNTIKKDSNSYLIGGLVEVIFNKISDICIESYDYAESYNKYQKGQRLVVNFVGEMETTILFK